MDSPLKPSDLLPELQGRLPIRVELASLSKEDFRRILTETEANQILQQKELFKTEGLQLDFQLSAIEEIAELSWQLNQSLENIGARRLRAVVSKVVEELSYEAPERSGETIVVDREFVQQRCESIVKNVDLSKYIL
eukprot:TRINITY_DN1263_c0_g1_i2.p1 TRINITY_DN1263_c0_g1~~TRINITY_DN1263_c0_g1_i2.p1  ORF type:complete len:136 (+),score=18.98 TRINITY_DN1263_c0_g1_i2:701-1108(+)